VFDFFIGTLHFTIFFISAAFGLLIVLLLDSEMMDSDDEMMIRFMQEEKNAAIDEKEHLKILVSLL
jgi:hypothetical protein